MTLWQKLTTPSPQIVRQDDRRQAQLLIWLHLILMPLGIFFVGSYMLTHEPEANRNLSVILQSSVIVVIFISYWLSLTSNYQWASWIIVLVSFSSTTIIEFIDPENRGMIFFLAVPIVFSSLFLGSRVTLGLVSIVIIVVIMMNMLLELRDFIFVVTEDVSFLVLLTLTVVVADRQRHLIERDRQTRLTESEARYRQLTELSPEPIMVCTPEKILYGNNAAKELLKRIPSLRFTDNQSEKMVEHVFETIDGEKVILEISTAPVYFEKQSAVQVIARDVTEHRQIQAEHMELQLEQERVRLLEEFINGISHDIKSPLTIINLQAYILEKKHDPEEQKHHLETIKKQVQFLQKLIENLLTMNQLDNRVEQIFTALDISDLVRLVYNDYYNLAEEQSITLSLTQHSDNLKVTGNKDQIYRVLANLIGNAIHYTEPGGKIDLRLYQEDETIIFEVEDTGIGIDKESLTHIFDRFYRVNQEKTEQTGGAGLGLSIVKKIVESHQGTISVTSEPGHGSCFQVALRVQSSDTDLT